MSSLLKTDLKGRKTIALFATVFSLLVSLIYLGYSNNSETEQRDLVKQSESQYLAREILLEGARVFEDYYFKGTHIEDFSKGELQCLEKFDQLKAFPDRKRCYAPFVECVLKQSPVFQVNLGGGKYPLSFIKQNQHFLSPQSHTMKDKWGQLGYGHQALLELRDGDKQFRLKVFLKNNCHQKFLPHRFYGVKERVKLKSDNMFEWDNLGRNIYLDQFQVTEEEILEWREFDTDWNHSGKRAYQLTLRDMHRFCSYKGKQLMTVPLWDAASFLPLVLDDPTPLNLFRYPYPWSIRKSKVFLHKLKADEGDKISKDNCKQAYVKDCKGKLPYSPYFDQSKSWLGIGPILGGPLEVFRNPLRDKFNLKLSSFHFGFKSKVHAIGRRGAWSGVGFAASDISVDTNLGPLDFPSSLSQEEINFAFRCYKEEKK